LRSERTAGREELQLARKGKRLAKRETGLGSRLARRDARTSSRVGRRDLRNPQDVPSTESAGYVGDGLGVATGQIDSTTTTGSETPAVNQSAQIAILNYVVGNPIGSQNEQEFRNFMLQLDNTGYGKLDLNSSGAVDTTDATFIGNQLVGNLSSVNPTAYARYLRVITPSDSSYIGKSDFGGGVFAGGFFTGPTRSLRSVWAAGYPGAIVNGTTHASTVAQNASSFDTYIGNASTRGAFSNTTVQAGEPAMTNPVFYEGFYNQAAPTYYWYESYGSGSSTKTLQIYWGGTLIVNGTYAIGTTSYNNGTNNYVRHSGISNGFAFGGGPQSSSSDKYGNVVAYYAVFQATTSL
jgi:hypothetical protein